MSVSSTGSGTISSGHQEGGQQRQQRKAGTDLHVITENGEQCFMWRANQLSYIAQDRQELPIVLGEKFGPLATKLDLSYNSLTSFKNIDLFTNLNELILDNNSLEDGHLDFKQNLRLKTLSLNKNKLLDLYRLVNSIKSCFPNLEFLSLIGNPLCPSLSAWQSFSHPEATMLPQTGDQRFKHSANGSAVRPTFARPSATSVVVDGRHLFDLSDSATDLTCSLALDGRQTEFNYQKYRYFIIYHLPNLRFLDSSPIGGQERDEAFRRFYWMQDQRLAAQTVNSGPTVCDDSSQHNNGSGQNNDLSAGSGLVLDETSLARSDHQEVGFQLTIISNHNSDAESQSSQRQQQQQQQTSRGQSATGVSLGSSLSSSFATNSLPPAQRYTLKLRFKVPRAFSRLYYKYTGKNSEGNRFIRNHDL